MALGIVKYFYHRPSQSIGIIWFAVSFFAVSCRGARSQVTLKIKPEMQLYKHVLDLA